MKQSTLTDKTTRRARSFSTACAEWWADLRSLKNQRLRQIIYGWSVWDTSSSYTTDLTAQRIASCKKKLPFTKTSFDYKRMPCKSLYQMDEYKSAREQYAPQMSCKTSTLPLLLIHTQIYKLWASKTLSKLQLMITLSYVSLNAPWNTLPKHQFFRFLDLFHLLLNACLLLSLNYEFSANFASFYASTFTDMRFTSLRSHHASHFWPWYIFASPFEFSRKSAILAVNRVS